MTGKNSNEKRDQLSSPDWPGQAGGQASNDGQCQGHVEREDKQVPVGLQAHQHIQLLLRQMSVVELQQTGQHYSGHQEQGEDDNIYFVCQAQLLGQGRTHGSWLIV